MSQLVQVDNREDSVLTSLLEMTIEPLEMRTVEFETVSRKRCSYLEHSAVLKSLVGGLADYAYIMGQMFGMVMEHVTVITLLPGDEHFLGLRTLDALANKSTYTVSIVGGDCVLSFYKKSTGLDGNNTFSKTTSLTASAGHSFGMFGNFCDEYCFTAYAADTATTLVLVRQ